MRIINSTVVYFLLIALAVFGLYYSSLQFEFVLDDKIVITDNAFVKKGIKGIPEIFGSDSMTGFMGDQPNLLAGGRYRPLSLAVFAIGHHFFGPDAFRFHLLNLLFYTLCCIFLYLTASRLFRVGEKQKPFLLLSVLIFAVHPVHTEVVANIKGLDEILAFLFGTIAFWFFLIFHDTRKRRYILLGSICFLLSLLAKESTLPLVAAIPVALYFFRETTLKKVFHLFLILLVPTAFYVLIRFEAMGFLLNNEVKVSGIMNDPYIGATQSQKYGTILFTLLLYLKLLFFPHPLTHDYYPYHIQLIKTGHPLALLSLVIIAALIWVAVRGIKHRSKISYIIFFFFITLSIVSNVIINVGSFMNERFLFVPSLALPLFLFFLFDKYSDNKKILPVITATAVIWGAGFVFLSAKRIPDWKNNMSLNRAAVRVSKNSARANCFYAVALYNEILEEKDPLIKKDKTREAIGYINKSLSIYPEYADALRMKAGLAAEEYKLDPDVDKLLLTFLEILAVRHVAYVDEFTDWLARRADKNKMANYYFETGYQIFAVEKRNFNMASHYLQKGFELLPSHSGILFGNCIVHFLTGNHKKCVEFGNAYLQTQGENAEIYFYIGNAQIRDGNQPAGLQNLEKAYRLNPELRNRKLN